MPNLNSNVDQTPLISNNTRSHSNYEAQNTNASMLQLSDDPSKNNSGHNRQTIQDRATGNLSSRQFQQTNKDEEEIENQRDKAKVNDFTYEFEMEEADQSRQRRLTLGTFIDKKE